MTYYDKLPPKEFEYEILSGSQLLFFAWAVLSYYAQDSTVLIKGKK